MKELLLLQAEHIMPPLQQPGIASLPNMLVQFSHLEELQISNIGLTDEDLCILVPSLRTHKQVRCFDLSEKNIIAKGLKVLPSELFERLCVLYFQRNQPCAARAHVLAINIPRMKDTEKLFFGVSGLGNGSRMGQVENQLVQVEKQQFRSKTSRFRSKRKFVQVE
jgi:hypothetical protein